ncbi:MAG: hypothetical protein ABI591_20295 [Kofleriaceae bacterium]
MPLSTLAELPPLAIRRHALVLATVAIAACFTIGVAVYIHVAPHHHHHVTRTRL